AFDCDKTKNSCPQVEEHYKENIPDMVENYMDYASEDCMNMFTHGQTSLMRNVLTGPRSGLIEAVSAVTQAPNLYDLNIYPNPSNGIITIPLVGIQSDLRINLYDINGKLTFMKMEKEHLASLDQITINVGGFAPGIYIVEVMTDDKVGIGKVIIW
ncbi:MAG: zinc-dependent metalloprotease, partial [Bacteroidota bacterium]|nr:zinc-dependent metalloprotease [Bacteroidota bacterium]